MIKFIKEFLFLTKEDKLYMLPWDVIKWLWEDPYAYKFKGTMIIDKRHWWNRKRPSN
jgi:hypothetical protein